MTRPNVLRELRPFRGPLSLVLLYAFLAEVFSRLSLDHGRLTPGGSPDFGMMAFGGLVLALRIVSIFVVPAIVVYRLVNRAVAYASLGSK